MKRFLICLFLLLLVFVTFISINELKERNNLETHSQDNIFFKVFK